MKNRKRGTYRMRKTQTNTNKMSMGKQRCQQKLKLLYRDRNRYEDRQTEKKDDAKSW